MNLDFFTVAINIAVLVFLAVPGYILRKIKFFKEKDSKPVVMLLIYITQPFMIIMSFQGKSFSPDILTGMMWVFIFTLFIHIAIIIGAKLLFDRFNITPDKKGIYTFASVFSNCGFMGIPVINALFRGTEGLGEMLIYVSVYIAVFSIVNWTIGIYIISGNKKYISIKNAFINPVTISLAVSLTLFFGGVNLYAVFNELAVAFKMLGDMTTPLAMIIIGIKLAEMSILKVFSSPLVYLSTFIKLIAAPVIMFFTLSFFNVPQLAVYVLVIITAMPTATLTVANAERFGGDSITAAKTMICSTLLCVITIPLICLLF